MNRYIRLLRPEFEKSQKKWYGVKPPLLSIGHMGWLANDIKGLDPKDKQLLKKIFKQNHVYWKIIKELKMIDKFKKLPIKYQAVNGSEFKSEFNAQKYKEKMLKRKEK